MWLMPKSKRALDGGLEIGLVVGRDLLRRHVLPFELVAHSAAGNDRHGQLRAPKTTIFHAPNRRALAEAAADMNGRCITLADFCKTAPQTPASTFVPPGTRWARSRVVGRAPLRARTARGPLRGARAVPGSQRRPPGVTRECALRCGPRLFPLARAAAAVYAAQTAHSLKRPFFRNIKIPSSACPALAALWRGAALFALAACRCLVAFAEPARGRPFPLDGRNQCAGRVAVISSRSRSNSMTRSLPSSATGWKPKGPPRGTPKPSAAASKASNKPSPRHAAQELEAMQSSRPGDASCGRLICPRWACSAILLTAYFQWRTVSRLAEVSGRSAARARVRRWRHPFARARGCARIRPTAAGLARPGSSSASCNWNRPGRLPLNDASRGNQTAPPPSSRLRRGVYECRARRDTRRGAHHAVAGQGPIPAQPRPARAGAGLL